MTDTASFAALPRVDRRLLLAGLGSAAVALPCAALGAEADAELLALEHRLGEVLRQREELPAAGLAETYLARRRERPFGRVRPPRDDAETVAAANSEAGLCRRQAAWAADDAALRRQTRCDELAAQARALAEEAEHLAGAILARPAATPAGLAAKARVARMTGDERFAWSLAEDLLRTAELVNPA